MSHFVRNIYGIGGFGMPHISITRTIIYNITHIKVDFTIFDETYRRIRGNSKYKGFDCFKCHRVFVDGEKISLIFTDKGNRVVCHDCGVKFKNELEDKANV